MFLRPKMVPNTSQNGPKIVPTWCPKGSKRVANGAKWKSKVRWDLANEIDARALSTAGESLPDIDRELQLRLKDRALMHKYVDQATPAVAEEQ